MTGRVARWLALGLGVAGSLVFQPGGCSLLPNLGGLVRAFIPGTGG
jgi:hypothetical protein